MILFVWANNFLLIEGWSKPVLLAVILGPALVALGLYFGLRNLKATYLRFLSLAPLGLAVWIGIQAQVEMTRPGIKEYLGIGFKSSIAYGLIILLPLIAGLWICFEEFKLLKLDTRRSKI